MLIKLFGGEGHYDPVVAHAQLGHKSKKYFLESLSIAIDSQDEPRAQHNVYEREGERNLCV